MKEKKSNTRLKTFRKIVLRTLVFLILLILLTAIALSLPVVQTKIAHYATEKLNEQYGTNINVEQVAVTAFGGVKLKKVKILDHHNDTLIFAKRLNTSILDFKKLIDGQLIFGNIKADGLELNVKNYKGEKDTNLDKFVAAFDDGKKGSGKFLMTSKNISLINSHFTVIDENRENPKDVDFTNLNAELKDFKIQGPNVTTTIEKMSFKDHRGLEVENLASNFTYTKENIKLEQLDLKTKESTFKGDVVLRYNRKDFADFNNKVVFDINTEKAEISSNDIRYFYDELGENQKFELSGKIDGTLNNLYAKNLHLKDNIGSEIKGDVNFKNLFQKEGKGDFYMKGSFDKVASSYDDLTKLLPNVLGKKLPSSLRKLGKFNLVGDAEITTKTIDTNFDLSTKLGRVNSDIVITNIDNIDNAKYAGNIILDKFNLGSFLNKKELGVVSLNVDVDGKGFTEKYLDTKFSGDVDDFYYNGYTYKNINANGSFKKPIFKGKFNINDPNLLMDFDGLVDLSKKVNIYDFNAKVDYANLKNLNFIKDEIAVFRGNVVMNITGNSLDNLNGNVSMTNASYQNKKDIYYFDSLDINSAFDATGQRDVSIYSPNAIKGEIQGKFDFVQIPKMIQNSLGSLYTNYKPNPLKRGQFLKFNFSEFNKVIEIFYPDVILSDSATLNGTIVSDENDFKMNFSSNTIKAYNVEMDNIQVEIDNKNPLYNAYIQLDSIKTKQYKIRDFSLINVTAKDTLFFRTEFKGGDKGNDFYNLNLFHTINSDKKNVVGFNPSEVMFKDYVWNINEKGNDSNKIIFDKDLNNFDFNEITLSHENQSILLNGLLNGNNNKNLQLTFNDVDLNKITPDLNKFKFNGYVDGTVNIKQVNSIYQPTSNLVINQLEINENLLGNMTLDIEGDENFKKFNINSSVENENFESFNAIGNIEIVNDNALMDLVLNFKKFNLGLLQNLGGDVITNIRGSVSGSAQINGNVENLNYNGRLFVEDTGLTIPYLGTDYTLEQNSMIDVTTEKFIIQPTQIIDTKFTTNGAISGFIKHKKFGNWELNLDINTKKLLVLNTLDHDDAAYFGTAFMNGTASISGPTDGLEITVNAKSEKGTEIKIPINDAESVGDNEYVHFVTKEEKYNLAINEASAKRFQGLELDFDLDITEDANIEIILDRDSGHGMKGNGRGGLLFRINTLGKFEMYGDYQVYQGTYNFKYGGIINKPFQVKKFSSIAWEGNPYKAILNLEALYNTNANPAVLVENSSVNRKIPVQVVIGVKGTLDSPEPDFTINFPNVSSILKSEIDTKLDDPTNRQTQALALLSTGSFVTAENAGNAAVGSLYETAGSMLSSLFNDKDGKFDVGFDYTQADRTPGIETSGQVGVTLTTKINDRITINGKVGVPVGGVNESAIVGNVELQYRVNEDGTLNLRVFNRENDITYLGQGIGYTQGIGISYEVDFDTFKELVNKIFTKHKIEVVKDEKVIPQDSYFPDYVNPVPENQEEKEQEIPHGNKDAIPLDD